MSTPAVEDVLELHKRSRGKYEIVSKVPVNSREDLAKSYTPGVAYVSEAIKANREMAYEYTTKSNTIAIISDGTRVLGLGNIGAEAGLPVMEGKAILFKKLGGVDAIPICIRTTDENEIVKFVENISPNFGAINLEDIESPKVFRIQDRLSKTLDIPVFHDDRQGTAVSVLAALKNALKLSGKGKNARIVVNGAGSAGFGIIQLLSFSGYKNLLAVDSKGIIYKDRPDGLQDYKKEVAEITNAGNESGDLKDAISNADVFIGVSTPDVFKKEFVHEMSQKPIIFALANPVPEISYADAIQAGAFIAATGRSDAPNQVNNTVAFPGIFRGMLDARAKGVNLDMLCAAANEIANSVGRGLSPENIIPSVTNKKQVVKTMSAVASSVASKAIETNMARHNIDPEFVKNNAKMLIKRYWRIESRILQKTNSAVSSGGGTQHV